MTAIEKVREIRFEGILGLDSLEIQKGEYIGFDNIAG